MQIGGTCRGELMAVTLTREQTVAIVAESVKEVRVGGVCRVHDDRVDRHHEVGMFGENGTV